MEFPHRVLDVFVTNADDNQETAFDDQFICPVQSVTLLTSQLHSDTAKITQTLGGDDITNVSSNTNTVNVGYWAEYTDDSVTDRLLPFLSFDERNFFINAYSQSKTETNWIGISMDKGKWLYVIQKYNGYQQTQLDETTTLALFGEDIIFDANDNTDINTSFWSTFPIGLEKLSSNGLISHHSDDERELIMATYSVVQGEFPTLDGGWEDDTMTKQKWLYVLGRYNVFVKAELDGGSEFGGDVLDLATALAFLGEDGNYYMSLGKTTTAVIVADKSDWILPLWPMTNGTSNSSDRPTADIGDGDMFKDIEVGDLIRIGNPSTHGFTDYLTVVEKVKVSMLAASEEKMCISKDGFDKLLWPDKKVLDFNGDEITNVDRITPKIEYRQLATPVFALRLNHSVDATSLPVILGTEQDVDKEEPKHFSYKAPFNLGHRHSKRLWGGTAGGFGGHFFPMYHMKEWQEKNYKMTARLDHGVKEVKQIKLMGYSLINKRQVGPQNAHEMVQDDYLILRIKEVTGQLISNNRHANGAFAVLYSGSHGQNTKGGVDVHTYETDGLVVQNLTATNSVMRNLTLQLTDRTGKPAHFGRLHLWFKITATHG